MVPVWIRDIVALIARVGIGVIFIAHGWRKVFTDGVGETAAGFREAGVPLPGLSAWFVALVELFGGLAMIIGLLVPVAGVLLAAIMLGAFVFVHAEHGVFVDEGGGELVFALGATSLLLAVTGAGRLSLDHLWRPLTRHRAARHPQHTV
jgi:putative oxidoreductase